MLRFLATAAAISFPPTDTYRFAGEQAWIVNGIRQDCARDHYKCAVTAFYKNDVDTALRELRAAVRARDPRALREIGLMHLRGDYVTRDEAAATGWFYEAALLGDREAMRLLGVAFQRGIGVAVDPKLANYWLNRAATQR